MLTWKEINKKLDSETSLSDLTDQLLETLAANRNKVFHLEAITDDRLFVGTEIKADTYEEAELYLRLVFKEALLDNDKIEIIKVSEEWLH